MTPADRTLAASWALGLAEGVELERGARLYADDPEFRAEADAWTARLSPLLEEVGSVTPPDRLWGAIENGLGSPRSANDNAPILERQLRMWRGVTAMMTALAAAFALLLLFRPAERVVVPGPAPVTASAPLVAMVGEDQDRTMVVANWDPAQRRLVLAVAGDMPEDRGKAHELWVVPGDGTPRSLGVMPAGKAMHMDLAEQIAQLLSQGATIAISVEPPGGSPTGAPTGPVILSGKLESA